MDLEIPLRGNRNALEDRAEESCYEPQQIERSGGYQGAPEPLLREDSTVKAKDGGFDANHAGAIENLSYYTYLSNQRVPC